jgi:quercetin dioxygenase-like cupin family protein
VALEPGQIFIIPPHTEHSFFTEDEALRVIAYHPDTDTGPSDGDHPMINRTMVGGVSAARLQS